MSTGAAAELLEFSRFIAEQLRRDADCSLEQAVQQLRGYQGQLATFGGPQGPVGGSRGFRSTRPCGTI
jgi:hypothetical protein